MTGTGEALARLPVVGGNAVLSHSGVVRRWECDRNDHWNVQFHVRAFQSASEVLAAVLTGASPGAAGTLMRHYRFHGEVFCPESLRVRSARLEGGPLDGRVVHLLEKGPEARLCSAALELPAWPTAGLPAMDAAEAAPALPRSIGAQAHGWIAGLEGRAVRAPLGLVRPADADHRGEILAGEILSRVSAAAQHLLGGIGFTADWIDRTNLSRMVVEMKVTRHGPCRVGECLEAVSWLSAPPGGRAFAATHQIASVTTGAPVATVEQVMLVIDLASRKSVAPPDFIAEAAAAGARMLAEAGADAAPALAAGGGGDGGR